MKFKLFAVLSVAVLLTLVVPADAGASCYGCKCTILNDCYRRCREVFSDRALQTACYGGCIIGCITQGTD